MTFPLRAFTVLAFLAASISPCLAQAPSAVIDGAGMFSDATIRQAKTDLASIDRTYGVTVTIETVTTLRGQTIDEATVRKAEQLGHKGIFVLIAEREHKVEVVASPRVLQEELGKARLIEIRDTFTDEFRKSRVDSGLIKGVQAADKALAAIKSAPKEGVNPSRGGFLPTTPLDSSSAGTSPLVVRQQVKLTLAGARKVITGAEAKAVKEGWKMNIAVVDEGGHLLTFVRMDGARPASIATSTTKAVSAATFRQATGPLGGATPDLLHNLGIENASAASGGRFTTLPGGIPIVVDGQVIGGVGVGGGVGEQDVEVAKAGIAAFLEGLQVKVEETAKPKEEAKPKDKDKEPETTAKPKEAEGDGGPK
jgi:glc operon protein GlcG